MARFCVTHQDWRRDDVSLDELIVALADKLWKGKRITELEEEFLSRVASGGGRDRWEIYEDGGRRRRAASSVHYVAESHSG